MRRRCLVAVLLPALLLLFMFGWVLYLTGDKKREKTTRFDVVAEMDKFERNEILDEGKQ